MSWSAKDMNYAIQRKKGWIWIYVNAYNSVSEAIINAEELTGLVRVISIRTNEVIAEFNKEGTK